MDINDFILSNEPAIRIILFIGVLAVMGTWEVLAPRRALTVSKAVRWFNNLSLVALNTLLLRWLFPTAAVGMALMAGDKGWGLLNVYPLPFWQAVLVSVVVMDLVIYLQHLMFHAVPLFWRLHRVHHADLDYDLTTGARFHPIEIILSMFIKFAAILLLGPPVVAVVVFEVLLSSMAVFNHANIRLPLGLDRVLRLLVVTPDMHRVHHSVYDDEANSNFGFNLSWWDKIFGTYRDQPRDGHERMTIGIRKYRSPKRVTWLTGLLLLPFRGKVSDYAINRRHWGDDNDA